MANVTVSVPTSNITVDTTNSIVNVASTVSNVLVGESVFVSNSQVRAAISVSNVSGFGNLAYDNSTGSNGIIQYTGVSTSDIRGQVSATSSGDGSLTYTTGTGVIAYTGPSASETRAHFSATAPIEYNSTTGDISIDSGALFSGKTTDDLAQGTTNKYWSTSGAAVTTSALAEGTNLYYTNTRSRAALSGGTGISYNSSTGEIELTDTDFISGVTAGAGLTGGGTSGNITLNVGDGDGITVNADDIQVDSTVVRTTGAANISGLKTFYDDGIETRGVSSGAPASANFENTSVLIQGDGGSFTSNVATNFNFHDINISRGNINQQLGDGSASLPYRTNEFDDFGIKYYGNINLESRVTTPGSESNTYVQADMTRARNTKTNYLFMGSNATTTSNVLLGTGSKAAVIVPDAVRTNLSEPRFDVYSANANEWAGPDANIQSNATLVGQIVDTYNDQTIGGAKTFTEDLTVQGNVDVSGNLNYVEVQDLLVRENTITMNYGNTSVNTTSQVIVDRTGYPGGGVANAALIWQENLDKWQLNDGTNTSDIVTAFNIGSYAPVTSVNLQTGAVTLDSDDIDQGTTNLYYSQSRTRSDVDGETASPSGTGSLVYDNASGMFTYTPPDLSNKIELTSLSVSTVAASGSGSLAYTNSTGVFTFAPAVIDDTQIVNGTSSIAIPVTDSNIDITVNNIDVIEVSSGLVDVTGNITSSKNLSAVQASASDIGGLQAVNGQSTVASYNNRIPFVNTETGIIAVQASDAAANVYSVPRYSSIKLPDIPTNAENSNFTGQFTPDNIETIGQGGSVWDSVDLAMPPSSLAAAYDPKIYKRRAFALPAYGIGYTGEGATTHSTGTILFDTDSANTTITSAQSFGTIAGTAAYTTAPVSQGIIKFRTLQPDLLPALPTPYAYTEANDFANSTVAYIDDKFRIGREDNSTSFSFPKTAGSVNQTLVLDSSRDLGFEDKGQTISYTTAEISALASPVTGHVVYNITLAKLCYYNGSSWEQVTSTAMIP
jgi:hypothetical protein